MTEVISGTQSTLYTIFHERYVDDSGNVLPLFKELESRARQEIRNIEQCLNTDLSMVDDEEVINALKKVQDWKRERLVGIYDVLNRLKNGTFTFSCECKDCFNHPAMGGSCKKTDLTERKLIFVEATTCA
ncbi:hypothetical protein MNBD_BACTEROID05-90 [hydrothermal vent metagenome]|uniref:Uncharacterized protein n=1 Tax=hydrothermal vent metagenome TaxID=652676 RepID=A0A3B0TRH6_9ZZZZ